MFSLYLLKPLVFLLLCGLSCVCASVVNESPAQKEVFEDFLEKDQIKLTENKERGKPNDITIDSINSAFLIATDDVMVALADMSSNNKEDMVLAKYIETKVKNWGDEAIKQGGTNTWKTELATKKSKKTEGTAAIKNHAITVNDNKIYYITISNVTLKDSDEQPEDSDPNKKWHVRLVMGDFTGESDAEKIIKWQTTIYSKTDKNSKLENEPNTKLSVLPQSDGFAVVTEDEKYIIFAMKGTSSESGSNKKVVAFFQLDKSDGNNKFELFHVESTGNYYPSFFQWEGKMFRAPLNNNNEEVTVFDAAKKNLKKVTAQLFVCGTF